ncbi:hypothetical protein O1R50_20965 [Glycomyces luteolus]|uniref:Uncharacterized protein n=1 Tax=Glycomyces luteolus TaxID=2670330 RepID=A0A9X3SS58_9ACTN|nr:hypothetical protein [Glycomyces luteolus]MDA1362111.1 hypothetical protein [Glycomyces luteolus]
MTTTPDRSTEIASYLAAVERHLNDLPTHIRQDLMSELDAHLSEVAADLAPGAALRDLLGSPEAYARELRDTAEVGKEPVGTRMRRKLSETAAPALGRLKGAADRYAASTGYADAAELRERLRPGWWVLRGAIVAALFVYWLSAAQYGVTGFSIFGSIPGLLLMAGVLLVCVWASMRLGAKSMDWRGRRRRWLVAGGVAIVALAAYQFSWLLTGNFPVQYIDTASQEGDPYAYISDIYAYDENGNLLTGVYLFDQDGNPLWIGDPYNCPVAAENPFDADSTVEEYDYDQYGNAVESTDDRYGYQYPLCVPGSELTMPDGTPTPGEEPTTELPESATPSEEATSGPEETPTGEAATTSPEESVSPTPGDDPTK